MGVHPLICFIRNAKYKAAEASMESLNVIVSYSIRLNSSIYLARVKTFIVILAHCNWSTLVCCNLSELIKRVPGHISLKSDNWWEYPNWTRLFSLNWSPYGSFRVGCRRHRKYTENRRSTVVCARRTYLPQTWRPLQPIAACLLRP